MKELKAKDIIKQIEAQMHEYEETWNELQEERNKLQQKMLEIERKLLLTQGAYLGMKQLLEYIKEKGG